MPEYRRFMQWLISSGLRGTGPSPQPSNFKKHPQYKAWVAQETAPVTIPGEEAELTPEEYMSFIRKIWWEDPEFDNATIPAQAELLKAQIEAEGFSIYSPGYDLALAYKNSFKEQGLDIIQNWEGKGYDIAVDEHGEKSIISGTALDETEMSTWQKSQYELDLKQFGLTEEKFAFQQQQALQQTQFQQAQMQIQQSQARQAEMQAAAQLAALGEEGWIQSWYAQQAKQAKFGQEAPGWDKTGFRNPYAAYLKQYQPEVLEQMIAAGTAPIEQATQPLARFGEPYRKPEEYTYQPQGETIDIKPDGAVKITVGSQIGGMRGQTPEALRDVTPPTFEETKGQFVTKTPKKGRARPTPRPTAPPTPAWLPQFAPWLTAGQPIERGQMPTPSGQQWQGITPSVMGGLRGFTKWGGAGRSLEDIFAAMQRMQPEAPWGGRGRWQTARQV